jgi:two-component system, response regulator, stage 0 sporulation protein F
MKPRIRVLVAEDDAAMRCMLVEQLLNNGCEVYEASRGDEALGVMTRIAFHGSRAGDLQLAILDVRMPGMSGLEIVYELRQRRWSTPLLLMTAFPDPELLEEAERLGVGVLEKPFELDHLAEAISALGLEAR